MLTLFAYAGHSHGSTESMSAIDHCMPIIIGAGGDNRYLAGHNRVLIGEMAAKKAGLSAKENVKKIVLPPGRYTPQ